MLMTPMAMMRPRNGDSPPARRVSSASPSLSPLIRYSRTYASSSSQGVPTVSMSMTSFFMSLNPILRRSAQDLRRRADCGSKTRNVLSHSWQLRGNLQRIEQLPNRVRRFLQRGAFLLSQRDLDDLLDAVAAEL